MKNTNILILFILFFSIGTLCSCSDDDNSNYATFNGMSVTIQGDEILGYKLYTDFDAILVPTNINDLQELKKVQRAQISFDMLNGNTNIENIKAGESYEIILNRNGINREIPTYRVNIDTLSQEYQMNGNDSIAIKNKKITSLNKESKQFYIKNGYLNIAPTFEFSPNEIVYFALYYDGMKDIDVINKKITLSLYFNNNAEAPYGKVTSLLSFRMSEDIYGQFIYEGIDEDETITVSLKANTQNNQSEELQYTMKLKDFALPYSH